MTKGYDLSGLKVGSASSTIGGLNLTFDPDQMLGKDTKRSSGQDDFLSALSKMQQRSQAETGLPPLGGLKLGGLDVDCGLATTLGLPETGVMRLLREAKELIAANQHREALVRLEEALVQAPCHHEALYLKATCLSGLGDPVAALRLLAAGQKDPTVVNRLMTRINELRREIGSSLSGLAIGEFFGFLQANQLGHAEVRLAELVALAPESVMLHYLLAGSRMMQGKNEAALRAVDAGLRAVGPSDQEMLKDLRANIVVQLAREKLDPARQLYKRQQYAKAGARLRTLEASIQAIALCKTFAAYLHELERQRRGPAEVIAPGSPEDVDNLFWYLLEPEIVQIRVLAQADRHAAPEGTEH